MPSARLAAMLAVFAVLSLSCGNDDHDATRDRCNPALHREALERCLETRDQAACESAGGSWERGGLLAEFHCFCTTGQSGCPCTESSQCLGNCAGPPSAIGDCPTVHAGVCEGTAPAFGCRCVALEPGRFTGFCSD